VLGQAQTPRRRLFALGALVVAVLAAPAVVGANPSHDATSLRARDAAVSAKTRAAVLGLYALDQRLAHARARLDAVAAQAASLETERATVRLELDVARRSVTRSEGALALRVRELYEQGSVEPIEVLFGARSLEDAVTNLDDLANVSAAGEATLTQLQAAKKRLAADSKRLALREAALASARRQAAATAAALDRTRAARTSYLASLRAERRLTRKALAALVTEARAAEARSAALSRAAAAPAAPAVAPGGGTLTVVATGYSIAGRTSTGLPAGVGVAAVDPSVIPLGTHFSVPGYGEAVAADTGGAVVGGTIDLWFPTLAEANAWGRRTVTVTLH
jgi:3D (Asp-Asp-Asp) domain-containing protein